MKNLSKNIPLVSVCQESNFKAGKIKSPKTSRFKATNQNPRKGEKESPNYRRKLLLFVVLLFFGFWIVRTGRQTGFIMMFVMLLYTALLYLIKKRNKNNQILKSEMEGMNKIQLAHQLSTLSIILLLVFFFCLWKAEESVGSVVVLSVLLYSTILDLTTQQKIKKIKKRSLPPVLDVVEIDSTKVFKISPMLHESENVAVQEEGFLVLKRLENNNLSMGSRKRRESLEEKGHSIPEIKKERQPSTSVVEEINSIKRKSIEKMYSVPLEGEDAAAPCNEVLPLYLLENNENIVGAANQTQPLGERDWHIPKVKKEREGPVLTTMEIECAKIDVKEDPIQMDNIPLAKEKASMMHDYRTLKLEHLKSEELAIGSPKGKSQPGEIDWSVLPEVKKTSQPPIAAVKDIQSSTKTDFVEKDPEMSSKPVKSGPIIVHDYGLLSLKLLETNELTINSRKDLLCQQMDLHRPQAQKHTQPPVAEVLDTGSCKVDAATAESSSEMPILKANEALPTQDNCTLSIEYLQNDELTIHDKKPGLEDAWDLCSPKNLSLGKLPAPSSVQLSSIPIKKGIEELKNRDDDSNSQPQNNDFKETKKNRRRRRRRKKGSGKAKGKKQKQLEAVKQEPSEESKIQTEVVLESPVQIIDQKDEVLGSSDKTKTQEEVMLEAPTSALTQDSSAEEMLLEATNKSRKAKKTTQMEAVKFSPPKKSKTPNEVAMEAPNGLKWEKSNRQLKIAAEKNPPAKVETPDNVVLEATGQSKKGTKKEQLGAVNEDASVTMEAPSAVVSETLFDHKKETARCHLPAFCVPSIALMLKEVLEKPPHPVAKAIVSMNQSAKALEKLFQFQSGISLMRWVQGDFKKKTVKMKVSSAASKKSQAMAKMHAFMNKEPAIQTKSWERAALNGHLDLLQYFGSVKAGKSPGPGAANRSKSLRTAPPRHAVCPREAFNLAVEGGQLPVVEWLYNYLNPRVCSAQALERAAQQNHLATLEWLASRQLTSTSRGEGARFSTLALALAAGNGHLKTVEWLHKFRPYKSKAVPPGRAVAFAAEKGHLCMVEWLIANQPDCAHPPARAFDLAALNGHLHVLEWLFQNNHRRASHHAEEWSLSNGHPHITRWLRKNMIIFDECEEVIYSYF